ncbi:hypothetical protein ACIHFD_29475 [Nonomuraea sp. NPDC051941]|uniref:hypothetical protein n=1 Tax=Nonomuraea sp. NPDC051941 TaxID=3364373 RepID=UPI0037C50C7B
MSSGPGPSKAGALYSLGDAHHDAGDLDAARRAWQDAFDILDQLEHQRAEVVHAKLQQFGLPDAMPEPSWPVGPARALAEPGDRRGHGASHTELPSASS